MNTPEFQRIRALSLDATRPTLTRRAALDVLDAHARLELRLHLDAGGETHEAPVVGTPADVVATLGPAPVRPVEMPGMSRAGA